MYCIIALSHQDDGLLFFCTEQRRRFIRRAVELGARWGVKVLAWHLCASEVELLVHGRPDTFKGWVRLLHSSHSTELQQLRGRRIDWARPELSIVSDPVNAARNLHSLDPFNPWSSLWDAAGLRSTPQFSAAWLQSQASPEQWWQWAGGPHLPLGAGPMEPATWSQVLQAVDAVTWQGAARQNRVLLTQLAFRAGWPVGALCEQMEVGRAAVRKSLNSSPRPELGAAQAHLRHPGLSEVLEDEMPTLASHTLPRPIIEALEAAS